LRCGDTIHIMGIGGGKCSSLSLMRGIERGGKRGGRPLWGEKGKNTSFNIDSPKLLHAHKTKIKDNKYATGKEGKKKRVFREGRRNLSISTIGIQMK